MSSRLIDVYLYGKLVGTISPDKGGNLTFEYDGAYARSEGAYPLSDSLPIKEDAFTSRECEGYFSGLLPEGLQREILARNLGISARNDYAMIEEIGGECAGAVSFVK